MDTNTKFQGHTVKLNVVNEGVLSGLKLTQVSLLTGLIALPFSRMPTSEVVLIGSLLMLLSGIVFLVGQVRCCLSDVSSNVNIIRFSTACAVGGLVIPFLGLSAGLAGLTSLSLNVLSFLSLLMYAAAISRDNGHHDLAKRFQRVVGGLVVTPLALFAASTLNIGPVTIVCLILFMITAILSPVSYIRGIAALGQRAALAPC